MSTILNEVEEISLNDKTYAELTQKNMNALNALRKSAADFLNSTSELLAYAEKLMYVSGKLTAQLTAQNVPTENKDVMETTNKMRNATNL